MKNTTLDKDEKEIERNFEKYQTVSKTTHKRLESIIENSRKSRPISFRINEMDLERLKEKANKNGLPYQTMINVVLHKFVTDSYLEKDEITKFLKLKRAG